MQFREFIRCVLGRKHHFKPSHKRPGYETCTFCHYRRLRQR